MPVMPLSNESYVDTLASNILIADMQPDNVFVHDRVAGQVPVQMPSGLFYSIPSDPFSRSSAQITGPDAEAPEVEFHVNPNNRYDCQTRRVRTKVSRETLANVQSPLDVVATATKLLARQMKIRKELDFVNAYVRPGIWTGFYGKGGTVVQDFDVSQVQSSGNTSGYSQGQWNLASSNPILDVQYAQDGMMSRTGYKANVLLLAKDVASALKNHPAIIERIKYVQKGVITWDLVAELFDVEEVVVMEASLNSAQEGQAASMGFLSKNCALLLYRTPTPALMEPSAVYCFSHQNPEVGGLTGMVSSYNKPEIRSTVYEASAGYDFKVIASDFGTYFSNVLA